jgi:hypothetical protein
MPLALLETPTTCPRLFRLFAWLKVPPGKTPTSAIEYSPCPRAGNAQNKAIDSAAIEAMVKQHGD